MLNSIGSIDACYRTNNVYKINNVKKNSNKHISMSAWVQFMYYLFGYLVSHSDFFLDM